MWSIRRLPKWQVQAKKQVNCAAPKFSGDELGVQTSTEVARSGPLITSPEQVGCEVEGARQREARDLVQPQAPTPGEVELNDADVPLPGLILQVGGVIIPRVQSGAGVIIPRVQSGAEQRDGLVDKGRRKREEAAEHGDGVARVQQWLGERGGDVVVGGGRGGRRRGELVEARVGVERRAAGQ